MDTAAWVDSSNLEGIGAGSEPYQPTAPVIFDRILQQLPVRPSDYTFLDLGSGKGLTLLLASQHSFRRIIGVEFAGNLCRTALRNVEHYRSVSGNRTPIEIVRQNAAEYIFPAEPLVIYLFNPFGAEVMARVISNLTETMEASPRDIWVVYFYPVCKQLFDRCDSLSVYSEKTETAAADAYAIYRRRLQNDL